MVCFLNLEKNNGSSQPKIHIEPKRTETVQFIKQNYLQPFFFSVSKKFIVFMDSSDDSRPKGKGRRAVDSFQSDEYERDERRPKKSTQTKRIAPKTRGDRVRTQIDELGDIERVFRYDSEDTEDVGRYKNIRIINYLPGGKKKRGQTETETEADSQIETSDDGEGIELGKMGKGENQAMLAHKPPPKKIDSFEIKINELNHFIHPYGFFWTFWTFLIILLCIYELLMVPFVVAWNFLGNGGLYAFDYIVDTVFVVDIALIFFVARAPRTYYLVTDRTRIQVPHFHSFSFMHPFLTLHQTVVLCMGMVHCRLYCKLPNGRLGLDRLRTTSKRLYPLP